MNNRPSKGLDLKRSLENDFGAARDAASKRYRADEATNRRQVYERWLPTLAHSCGYCLAEEPTRADSHHHHRMQSCPYASDEVKGIMYDLSKKIKYPPRAFTCFKCHISSLGNNTLHPEFGRGPCPNPNLVMPLAIHLFSSDTHHASFQRVTGITLDNNTLSSLDSFAALFSRKDDTYGTFGMAVIAWLYEFMDANGSL